MAGYPTSEPLGIIGAVFVPARCPSYHHTTASTVERGVYNFWKYWKSSGIFNSCWKYWGI